MLAEHCICTLARQLAQALSAYAESFRAWCHDPSDVSHYERAHVHLNLVRILTGKAFPAGRGELGELLLCHSGVKTLVLRLHIARSAREATRPGDQAQLRQLQNRHAAMVAALRAVCQRHSSLPEPKVASARPESEIRLGIGPRPAADG